MLSGGGFFVFLSLFVCFVFGFVFVLLFFCGYKLADINIATYYTKKNQEKVLWFLWYIYNLDKINKDIAHRWMYIKLQFFTK